MRNPQAVAAKMGKKNKGEAQRTYLHSVIGKGINAKDGLEFVVYKGIQCYPEFLIYYERVSEKNPSRKNSSSRCIRDYLSDPATIDDDDSGDDGEAEAEDFEGDVAGSEVELL